MVYQLQLVLLSMTFNEPYPEFKVTTVFDVEYLRNSAKQKHSYNEILIGTYTRLTQRCNFERVTRHLG